MKSLNSACAASLLEQGLSMGSETERGLLDSPCSTASSLSSLTPPATPFSGATKQTMASLPNSSLLLRQLSEPSSMAVAVSDAVAVAVSAGNDYGVLLDAGREYIALGELNYNGQTGGASVQEMDFLESINGYGYSSNATRGSYTSYGYGMGPGNFTEHSVIVAAAAGAATSSSSSSPSVAATASHANGALNYLGTPGKAAVDIDPKEIDQYLMDQMLPISSHHVPTVVAAHHSPPLNSSASLSSACSSASSQPVDCMASPTAYYDHMNYPTQGHNSAGYPTTPQYVNLADSSPQQEMQVHSHPHSHPQQQQQQHQQQQHQQQQQLTHQQQHHHLWGTYVNP